MTFEQAAITIKGAGDSNGPKHPAQPQPEVGENTGSSASEVTSTTPLAEGAAFPESAPETAVPAAAPVAGDEINPWLSPELQYLADEDYELPPADPALLASANRMLGERLDRVAHVLRGCGLPALADVKRDDDLQQAAAALSGAYRVAVAEIAGLQADVAILQEQLDETSDKLLYMIRDTANVKDVHDAATGYLVRAPKCRPRIVTKPETAVERAKAAARGTGRSDVYALVHVGTARMDAVYREAK